VGSDSDFVAKQQPHYTQHELTSSTAVKIIMKTIVTEFVVGKVGGYYSREGIIFI
jgi:hypothetical protein